MLWILQVVLNLLGGPEGTIPLEDAIDAPRLHHPLVPEVLEYERKGAKLNFCLRINENYCFGLKNIY